eukprot:m.260406 g.260406  ORF g.260406 m.260406 type:complete len:58 (-) comp26645_c1_seq1:24-197(-)
MPLRGFTSMVLPFSRQLPLRETPSYTCIRRHLHLLAPALTALTDNPLPLLPLGVGYM